MITMADDEEVREAVPASDEYRENTEIIDLEEPTEEEKTYTEQLSGLRESIDEALGNIAAWAKKGGYQGGGASSAGRFERRDSMSSGDESNYDRLGERLGRYIRNLPEEHQHGEFDGNEYDITYQDGERIAGLIEDGEYEDAKGYAQAVATIAGDEELGETLTQRIEEIEQYETGT